MSNENDKNYHYQLSKENALAKLVIRIPGRETMGCSNYIRYSGHNEACKDPRMPSYFKVAYLY